MERTKCPKCEAIWCFPDGGLSFECLDCDGIPILYDEPVKCGSLKGCGDCNHFNPILECFGTGFDITFPDRCEGCMYIKSCKVKTMKARYPKEV